MSKPPPSQIMAQRIQQFEDLRSQFPKAPTVPAHHVRLEELHDALACCNPAFKGKVSFANLVDICSAINAKLESRAPTPPAPLTAPASRVENNPEIVAMLKQSTQEASDGKLLDLGSFAEKAPAPVTDEPGIIERLEAVLWEARSAYAGQFDVEDIVHHVAHGQGKHKSAPVTVSDADVERAAERLHRIEQSEEEGGEGWAWPYFGMSAERSKRAAKRIRNKVRALLEDYESARGAREVVRLDDHRCARCGWRLAVAIKDGCVRGNCAYRPEPPLARHQFYDAERWDRETTTPPADEAQGPGRA